MHDHMDTVSNDHVFTPIHTDLSTPLISDRGILALLDLSKQVLAQCEI